MEAKTRWIVVWVMLLGVVAADAFLYTSEDATWWTSGATGDWMEQAKWTDYGTADDWIVAGWVVGNPEYSGSSTDRLWNDGYGCIDHGTVNITPSSRPDGKVERKLPAPEKMTTSR